jgi:hypothetical protein
MEGESSLFVILKRKNLPKEKNPTQIIFKGNKKGWMTEELMVEWLREVCHGRLGAFSGHLTEKVKTVASNLLNKGRSDHTRRRDLSVTGS